MLRQSRKLGNYKKEIRGISMQINLQRLTVPTHLTFGSSLHHRRDPRHQSYYWLHVAIILCHALHSDLDAPQRTLVCYSRAGRGAAAPECMAQYR